MTRTSYGIDEGADRFIHGVERTDGADTVIQPYHIEAEPETATYIASRSSSAVAAVTASSHLMQVMAGASLRVGIKRIRIRQVAAATTTALAAIQLWRLSSAGTGGTTVTPEPLDPAEAACGATAMTLPTAKGTESSLISVRRMLVHTTATTVGLSELVFDFTHLREKCLWVAAGTSNGIALKNPSADATLTLSVEVELVESDVA